MPATRCGFVSSMSARNRARGSVSAALRSASSARPRFQVTITVNTTAATTSGNQPPCAIFAEQAAKNARSKQRNTPTTAAACEAAPVPEIARDEIEQHRGDRHRAGDRDAVGVGQVVRRPESEHERDAGEHEQPVHLGDVDLPLRLAGGVDDGHARQVAELNGLPGQRERARDQRLRRHHRRERREHHHRDRASPRGRARRTGSRRPPGARAASPPARSS